MYTSQKETIVESSSSKLPLARLGNVNTACWGKKNKKLKKNNLELSLKKHNFKTEEKELSLYILPDLAVFEGRPMEAS